MERSMVPMMKKMVAAGIAVTTLASTFALGATEANAQYYRRGPSGAGIAAGVIGGVAAGALIAGAARPAYGAPAYVYDDPGYDAPVCHFERQRVFIDEVRYTYRRVRVCE